MARYDREFLVPYLEDICALHLSKKKLIKMISASEEEISRINEKALSGVENPRLEAYKGDGDLDGVGEGCLGVLCSLMAIIFFFAGFSETSLMIMALMFCVAGVALTLRFFGAKDRANNEIRKRNDEKERDHALAQMAALVVVQPQIEAVKKQIATYKNEIKKIEVLLEKLYGVNVIPKWYRDLYPAVYLYDWFSNSRADDLDLALNTLVLEQIKDQLDIIIRNQGDIIINQRVMIANQEKSMEQMERHHKILVSKLDRIGIGLDERNMYLGMIEANTAANAYFAAANYLNK